MTAHLAHGQDFTALTVRDPQGACLTIERTDDGAVSAWIAEPGSNDGHSVSLDEGDRIAVVAYLSAGTPGALVPAADLAQRDAQLTQSRALAATYANEIGSLKAELERMRAEWDRLANEQAAMLGVVRAAEVWRAQFSKPADTKLPRQGALIAAVDALPNDQEPCDTCSSTASGCPECRTDGLTDPEQYLIWSHKQNAWWGPNGGRYFYDVTSAGRYTLDRANDYASTRSWPADRKTPPEVVVPAPPADVLGDPERIGPWLAEQIKAATDAKIAARRAEQVNV